MNAPLRLDTTQLAITAAVAIVEAPFVEFENQARDLAAIAACGFLTKQTAVDVAYRAALAAFGPGMVQRQGANAIQEIIAEGFAVPPDNPQPPKQRPYHTAQSTIDAFWYVVRNESAEYLADWLDRHPKDDAFLRKLWRAKCS